MIGRQHPLMIDDDLVVDLFAGGGGASSGIEAVIEACATEFRRRVASGAIFEVTKD